MTLVVRQLIRSGRYLVFEDAAARASTPYSVVGVFLPEADALVELPGQPLLGRSRTVLDDSTRRDCLRKLIRHALRQSPEQAEVVKRSLVLEDRALYAECLREQRTWPAPPSLARTAAPTTPKASEASWSPSRASQLVPSVMAETGGVARVVQRSPAQLQLIRELVAEMGFDGGDDEPDDDDT